MLMVAAVENTITRKTYTRPTPLLPMAAPHMTRPNVYYNNQTMAMRGQIQMQAQMNTANDTAVMTAAASVVRGRSLKPDTGVPEPGYILRDSLSVGG
jgi:hypothetical protein